MTAGTSHRAVARATRSPGSARRGGVALLLVCNASLTGCYSTRPVTTAPVAGTTVLLDLNDAARVQLGDRIGSSAARIDGIVQSRNDSAYVLRVSQVSYLDGRSNKWSGEPFTVPAVLVSRARVQEFSRARTTALGIGIGALLVAVFATTDFFGLSGPDKQPVPPPGGET